MPYNNQAMQAYNAGYAAGMQAMASSQQLNSYGATPTALPNNQTQNQGNLVWVENEGEARQYPVAPNSQFIMMDRNEDMAYIKITDELGKLKAFKAFSMSEVIPQTPAIDESYGHSELKTEVNELKQQMSTLVGALNQMMNNQQNQPQQNEPQNNTNQRRKVNGS